MVRNQSSSLKSAVKLILAIIGTLAGFFLAVKLSYYLAPFIIAFILASLIEPIIFFIVKKTKLTRGAAAPIVLLLFLILFGFMVALVVLKLISEFKSLMPILPKFFNDMLSNIDTLINKGTSLYLWLPTEITDNIGTLISNLSSTLMKLANSIVKGAFAIGFSIPEALIFILVTIVATYFLSSDRDRISTYLRTQLPESWISKFTSIKNDMFSAMFGYLKAQLILMCVTFTELYIGLSIMRLKYSLLLAFLISIVDALPILGTGTILIPWAIYEFLFGNIRMGISAVILYGIVLIIRQVIEPKIVGQQIGIHPLITLIAMYTGLRFFGFLGLVFGPITVLILKNILSGAFRNRSIKSLLTRNKTYS